MTREETIQSYLREAENIIDKSLLMKKSEVVVGVASIIQREAHYKKDTFESRTCKNCKYLIIDEDDSEDIECSEEELANHLGAYGEYRATIPSINFGCNKWEVK